MSSESPKLKTTADEEDRIKRVRLGSGALHVFVFNAFFMAASFKGRKRRCDYGEAKVEDQKR